MNEPVKETIKVLPGTSATTIVVTDRNGKATLTHLYPTKEVKNA